MQHYNEEVNIFYYERSNPYETTMPMKFYHFTSCQLVGPEISAKILGFFYKGLTEYLMFPEERYLQERKSSGKLINFSICLLSCQKT